MKFRRFLRDKAFFLVFFFALEGFTLAVVLLDRGNRLLGSNVAYLAAVSAVMAAAYLALLYFRTSSRTDAVRRILVAGRSGKPDALLAAPLPPPADSRDEAWISLVDALRRETGAAVDRAGETAREDVAFLAAWVHEMKTPVSVLTLMAERAAEEGLPVSAAELRDETRKLNDCLEKALYYSRLNDFARDYLISDVDPRAIASAVVKKLRRFFIARNVRPELSGPWYPVASDPKWLAFILEQLVSNAVKYSYDGGTVTIGMEKDETASRMTVRDRGIGIPPEDLPRLFTRSFTGANGRRSVAGSGADLATGMGLYLSRRLALRLGLEIEVGPGPDGGTVAAVVFPRLSDVRG